MTHPQGLAAVWAPSAITVDQRHIVHTPTEKAEAKAAKGEDHDGLARCFSSSPHASIRKASAEAAHGQTNAARTWPEARIGRGRTKENGKAGMVHAAVRGCAEELAIGEWNVSCVGLGGQGSAPGRKIVE